jgi:hypothetical protein
LGWINPDLIFYKLMMKDYSHCTKLGSEVVSLAAASSAAHPIQHSYGQLFFDGTSGPEEGFKTCVVWSPTIRERDGLFCRIGYLGVFSLSLSLCGHLSYQLSARRTKITINGQSVRDVFGHRLRIAVRGRSDDGHRTLQLAMMNVHFTHAGSEYVSSSRTYPTRFSDILFVF